MKSRLYNTTLMHCCKNLHPTFYALIKSILKFIGFLYIVYCDKAILLPKACFSYGTTWSRFSIWAYLVNRKTLLQERNSTSCNLNPIFADRMATAQAPLIEQQEHGKFQCMQKHLLLLIRKVHDIGLAFC